MDKPKIMNSLRKLSQGTRAEGEEDDYGDGQSDVLELYRIPASIEIPDDVLTPNQVGSVQFKKSKPWGFHPGEVTDFHGRVMESLAFYVKALETRDRNITKLATEVDHYKTDVQNIKFQLEMFQGAGGKALTDDEGNYVKESDLSESELEIERQSTQIQDLKNKLVLANKDIEIAQQELNDALAASASAPVVGPDATSAHLSDEERQELEMFRANQAALDEWEQSVNDEYASLQAEVEALRAGNGNAEVIAAKDADIANLREELQEASESTRAATSERDDALSTVEEYRQSVEALEASKVSLEQTVEDFKTSNQEFVDANAALSEENAALTTSNTELAGQLDSLNGELASLRAAVDTAGESSDETESLKKNVEELNAYIDTIESHVTTLEQAAATAASDDQRIAELEEQVAERDKRIAEMESNSGGGSAELGGYRLPPGIRPEDLGLA